MNEYERVPKSEIEKQKGVEVAKIVESVYDQLPPEVAAELVNPNVILTLAGLKGEADVFIDTPNPNRDEAIEAGFHKLADALFKINPSLEINFKNEPIIGAYDGIRTLSAHIHNRQTLEENLTHTSIPNLPSFKAGSEMTVPEWKQEVEKTFSDEDQILSQGVIKGYPDTATLDFYDAYKTGNMDKLEQVNIPYVKTYESPMPLYSYYPEHANDPSIVENKTTAGNILEGFYQSEWHQKIAPSLEYKRTKDLEN